MVKQSSRREFSISRFIEDCGIFGILWRELLFHFLSCLCQDHRKSEFSDMGMVFPKYSSESGCVSLLGIDPSGIFRFILFDHSKIS